MELTVRRLVIVVVLALAYIGWRRLSPPRRRVATLWLIALALTLGSAVWQRLSGPTHPVRVHESIGPTAVTGRLERSHSTSSGQTVALTVPDTAVAGIVVWQRLRSDDPWQATPMVREGDRLAMVIPPQPAAGKVAYRIGLSRPGPGEGEETRLWVPAREPVVTRFKGDVPAAVLIPHVLLIFAAMLWSARTGLAALARDPRTWRHTAITCALFFVAGLVLGPLVQKAAFGAFWTGWPLGRDLTDNKVAVAMLFWLIALWQGRGGRNARGWVITAAVVMLIVFIVPHSLLGSEHDYRAAAEAARAGQPG